MTDRPTIRLGIADDHKLFRKGMSLIFGEISDIDLCVQATDGQDLLDQLPKHPVDVLLLDLEMPRLDGRDTLQVLRKDYPDIKVLVLTMYENEEYMIHFMQEGASGYLLKDSEPEEVERAVRKVYADGRYLSEAVSQALLDRLDRVKMQAVKINRFNLVERELEVLALICEEQTTQEIADKLFLSIRTIESYRKRLLEKTGARNTAGLVKFAYEHQLIPGSQ